MAKWLHQEGTKSRGIDMKKVLVFAGTTEGRTLIAAICKDSIVDACVATDYGKEILDNLHTSVNIIRGRLTKEDMINLIKKNNYDLIVDTTHPYAEIVTKNIKEASEVTDTKYLRVVRKADSDKLIDTDNVIFVSNVLEAVEYLNSIDEKVLLTVGSKELQKFTKVTNFKERLFARVLPIGSIVDECNKLGYEGRQLLCMQGPFTLDLNVALIKQIGATIIVTKDGGNNGGFMEKYYAAKETSSKLLVIGRPKDEAGVSVSEAAKMIVGVNNETRSSVPKKEWFPFFLNIKGKNVLIVGGGNIALRRAKTLSNFDCNITVIGEKVIGELEEIKGITVVSKKYQNEDLAEADYVIAATDDEELNLQIGKESKKQGKMVNVVSHKENCDFYFPGVVIDGDVTIGITAQGNNHKLAKEITGKVKNLLQRR
ncbi:MAG: precorrin-6A reductase [Anaerovoracaceae bacterium]